MSSAVSIPDYIDEAPSIYKPRQPEKTVLYKIVQENLETFISQHELGGEPIANYVDKTFRAYLKCGILAYGFALVRCTDCDCKHAVAFSCRKRGVCPSCGAKYMAETGAHLVENVLPFVPYRQWVLSLPKRVRYFLHHNMKHTSKILRIFLRAVETFVRKQSGLRGSKSRIGAVSFIQRFGDSINAHSHFHSIVCDGVFAERAGTITFHDLKKISDDDVYQLTEKVKHRVLRYMERQSLIDPWDIDTMKTFDHHAGFSIDASVHISKGNRLGLERLIRYCSRPPFALGRLTQENDGTVVYSLTKPDIHGRTYLTMTPLELLEKISQLIPPPKVHRHSYYGVLAPNHRWRKDVILSAQGDEKQTERLEEALKKQGLDKKNKKVLTLWAMLLARIYETMPLVCPRCHAPMRIVQFVTNIEKIEPILESMGEQTTPPIISPARGPPEEDDFPIIEYD